MQQPLAQITWGHNIRILDTVKNATEREWYIRQTIEQGWTRNVLVHIMLKSNYPPLGISKDANSN